MLWVSVFHGLHIVKRGPHPTVHFSDGKRKKQRGALFLKPTGEEQYEAVQKTQSKLGTGR